MLLRMTLWLTLSPSLVSSAIISQKPLPSIQIMANKVEGAKYTGRKREKEFVRFYIRLYRGPPPPSGTVQRILSKGHLRWHVLQCRQLDGFAAFTSSPIVS